MPRRYLEWSNREPPAGTSPDHAIKTPVWIGIIVSGSSIRYIPVLLDISSITTSSLMPSR